jgi:hypothetical protein
MLARKIHVLFTALLVLCPALCPAADKPAAEPLCISGIYPHLAVYNGGGECGIGAVVPWAGKLWMITYPPHMPKGSPDKLYAISPDLTMEIRPESVGGTHANRLIHRESNQLVIGPYFIDDEGNVRVVDINQMVGRLTATARHLTDPAGKVLFFDMEGALYEVDVKTLAVNKLFDRVAPGAHGKGGYSGQGKLVLTNNGESVVNKAGPAAPEIGDPKKDPEAAGALAEWDGKTWRVVERRQYLDVTGPGGIYGAPDDKAPLWTIGWDKRSVILMLLDGGQWHKFRLPKASHAYDAKHGWYTEWPRIREIVPAADGKPARLMMDMNGMFFDFPQTLSAANTGGITPISSHLRYVPDFGHWNGRVVIAADDCSVMKNEMAGLSQSNLWFGSADELSQWGPKTGWGGVWLGDDVKAGQASDPFLVNGFDNRVLHLAHNAKEQVDFKLEADQNGDGKWAEYATVHVPAGGYAYHQIAPGLKAQWLRVTPSRDCRATAYFHFTDKTWPAARAGGKLFDGLADVGQTPATAALIRPAKHNRNLQVLTIPLGGRTLPAYYEVDEKLTFHRLGSIGHNPEDKLGDAPAEAAAHAEEVRKLCKIEKQFEVDEASVIFTGSDGKRYRLPRGDPMFDRALGFGWPRCIREVQSERYLMNVHGTFYELPRDKEYAAYLRPIASHRKAIMDFCSWRGLLVISGTKMIPGSDGHRFTSEDGQIGLWFGKVDDLWQLGQPVGVGGPWAKKEVKAGELSDPYLMTGYASKKLELITHEAKEPVQVTVEVDVDHTRFRQYTTFTVDPGKPFVHKFPAGYSAHWARLKTDKPCMVTATFTYEK